jgi:hypothetical protein
MKKLQLRTLGGALLAIFMLAALAQGVVSAQGGNGGNLVGSWNQQVSLRDCDSGIVFVSFPAMTTFALGGTSQQTAPPAPGSTFLPGHGVWSHQAGGGYSGAFQFFGLNPDGSVATRTIVRSAITLEKDGNSYHSTDTSETLNANGDLLLRACSTTTATRFE